MFSVVPGVKMWILTKVPPQRPYFVFLRGGAQIPPRAPFPDPPMKNSCTGF